MNPLLVRLGQAATRRGSREGVSPEFLESFPILGSVMSGAEAADGQAGVPAMTLRIFWEGDQAKFCLGRHGHPTCCFGIVPDPIKLLESIESELRAGRCEVKRSKQQ